MATRVFELARELGVTSKEVLGKCRAEGLDLKNHMATLSAGLEATIREWFTEGGVQHTAEETTAHVDLGAARAKARKGRRRKDEAESEAVAEVIQAAEGAVEAAAEAAAEAVAEVPAAEAAVAVAAAAETETAVAEAPAVEVVAPEAPVVEAPAIQPPPPPEPQEAAPPIVAAPPVAAPPAAAPVVAAAATAPAVEAAAAAAKVEPPPKPAAAPKPAAPAKPAHPKPSKPEIKPAGPQLVPRPATLRGPKVVRMEAPEHTFVPVRRRPPTPTGIGPAVSSAQGPRKAAKPPAVGEEEAESKKKGKRRSPRRRSGGTGRTAELKPADRIKEWREADLEERSARLAAAAGGGLRRHRASVGRKGAVTGPAIRTGQVEVELPITVKAFAAAAGIKGAEIIRKLMELGRPATLNQVIDLETAEMVASSLGIELVARRPKTAEEELLDKLNQRPEGPKSPRAPVVTFLGHVDHGKTSLLDRIRHTTVAAGEAGGITQHMGAYRYDLGDKHVVFLDTPGHEAFTAMRARGANMTDVVVLVVAADDGVMPQTVEAISHARAAKVPIVVALNKIDMPSANVQRALGQLAEHGLQPREWGGDVEVIQTSAVTGQGIDDLVEVLSLEAELLELRAEPGAPASGFVIEAEMDVGRGALARLLVLNGTLKVGDLVLAGRGYGRIRQLVDGKGRALSAAGPATPAEVAGMDEAPEAGDRFYVVEDVEEARGAAEDRRQRARAEHLAVGTRPTLESLLARIEAGEANEVPLIIKADVQGSIEALAGTLEKLTTEEVKVNILHAAVGGVSTGDVTLAEASGALIVGFNVVPDAAARQLAERSGVDIRTYRIIYEVIDDVRALLEEGLEPEVREEVVGRAEVRQTFKISRVGTIAGCHVVDGQAQRNAKLRIVRNNIVVEDDRALESLKRFKDDVREVRAGMECGVKIAGYDDVKEGDVLEFYQKVEVARKL